MNGAIVAGTASSVAMLLVVGGVGVLAQRRAAAPARRRLSVDRDGSAAAIAPSAVRDKVPSWFADRLRSFDLEVPAGTAWWTWLASIVLAVVVGLLLGGPPVAVALAGMALASPFAAERLGRARRARRIEAQLPGLLDAVGAGLRAGGSLHQAVLEAAPTVPAPLRDELAPVVRAVSAGQPLADELDGWAARRATGGVRMVVAVLVLGLRSGGPQVAGIEGAAATVRERLAVNSEVRALSSQARASAAVIVAAPLVFAGVAAMVDPSVLRFLVGTPAGVACLAGGAVLDASGALWMRRVTGGPG